MTTYSTKDLAGPSIAVANKPPGKCLIVNYVWNSPHGLVEADRPYIVDGAGHLVEVDLDMREAREARQAGQIDETIFDQILRNIHEELTAVETVFTDMDGGQCLDVALVEVLASEAG